MPNHNHIYSFNYDFNEDALCKLESKYIFNEEEKYKFLFSNLKIEPSSSAFIKKRLDVLLYSDNYDSLILKIRELNICIEDFKVEYFLGDKLLKSEVVKTVCNDEFQIFKRDYMLDVEKKEFIDPSPTVDTLVETPVVDNYKYKGAYMRHYFTYNAHKLDVKNEKLNSFVKSIKEAVEHNQDINIYVESSASKVTTKSFGTNDKLAKTRAEDIKALVLSMLSTEKIDLSKINIEITETLVQGPPYKRGNGVSRKVYEKYQYIQLEAK